jgi:5-methyltetrahydrofolate--homocysteine methyltransferase
MLLHKDVHAAQFIAGYARWTSQSAGPAAVSGEPALAAATSLYEAVLCGDRENVLTLLEAELANGAAPFALVQESMLPAIAEVGARYERREYFLPQLLRSAETMQSAFARLKPLLEQERTGASRPVVVLATVEGDIHDIGKNIVALMLSNHGFEVVDAGKDVKAEEIVATAYRHKASIIGLSALMTTTMVRMEDTVRLLKERGLPIRVMVGGAVLTPAYAKSIGADGYAADAVGAVRLANSLV